MKTKKSELCKFKKGRDKYKKEIYKTHGFIRIKTIQNIKDIWSKIIL